MEQRFAFKLKKSLYNRRAFKTKNCADYSKLFANKCQILCKFKQFIIFSNLGCELMFFNVNKKQSRFSFLWKSRIDCCLVFCDWELIKNVFKTQNNFFLCVEEKRQWFQKENIST